jgi:predicted regulator of Ras-like GTPase activity (Roadblock/LC7/MglB family)
MLGAMDAAQAIADLTEISPQIREVAIVGAGGSLVGSNAPDSAAARLVSAAASLVEEAERLRPSVAQLEAATVNGSFFVVRDGSRLIAATTTPEPTVGLVFYDLKTCLRSVDEAPPKKRRAPAKKAKEEADDAAS